MSYSYQEHIVDFTGRCKPNEDPYGDDITYDELLDSYEEVCIEREKLKKTIVKLEDENGKLLSTVSELHGEVKYLTHRLNNMTKPVKVPNYGYDIINDMILLKKFPSKFKGVGSNAKLSNEQG